MYRVENNGHEDLLLEEPSADYKYTYADYLQWQIRERLELFRGRIHKMSAPNTMHQAISRNLTIIISSVIDKKNCKLFAAPFDVRLPCNNSKEDKEVDTVVQPDISVICDLSKIDAKGCCGAPDLVIEILSPGNSNAEVQAKFELYEESGVKEYWIIFPNEKHVIPYTLANGKYMGSKPHTLNEIISSSAIPAIQLEVEQIFET